MSGALRGIGKQKIGGITNLIGYYVIGIPIAYLFGFHFEVRSNNKNNKKRIAT